ncbi:MAG TPA: hypothetical protein PLN47_06440 [Candidatus Atribacteria bacterium]|nr:hypothetical protein [Candidatus Atribacteria bacterium]
MKEFHFINGGVSIISNLCTDGTRDEDTVSLFLGYNKLVPAHVEPEYLG